MPNLNKLIEQITLAEKILLITHENPDGDAMGGMLALRLALNILGKKTTAVCINSVPQPFAFLPGSEKIQSDFFLGDHQLIIILDCGDLRRTGYAERLKGYSRVHRKRIINIDHHPKNDVHRISWYNYVDYEASSTSELIYKLLQELKIDINKNVATCLLCGIYTDTGGFRHANTSQEVFKIASQLMLAGAQLKHITKNISNSKSLAALRILGLALSRVKKDSRIGLVTSVITKKDLETYQASSTDLAGIVNLINSIPDTKAAILFSEPEVGKIRASVRTERNDVDVSKLAAVFGGGGLKKASGFSLDGKIIQNKDGSWKIMAD